MKKEGKLMLYGHSMLVSFAVVLKNNLIKNIEQRYIVAHCFSSQFLGYIVSRPVVGQSIIAEGLEKAKPRRKWKTQQLRMRDIVTITSLQGMPSVTYCLQLGLIC